MKNKCTFWGFNVINISYINCSVLLDYLIFNNAPPGWTSLSLLISVLGGMQLLFLVLIGEYVGYIFEQVKIDHFI